LSPSTFQKNPEKKATTTMLPLPSSTSCYNKTKTKKKGTASAMQNKKEEGKKTYLEAWKWKL
jgi:hypothetical protein